MWLLTIEGGRVALTRGSRECGPGSYPLRAALVLSTPQHAGATATGSWLFDFQPSEYRGWGVFTVRHLEVYGYHQRLCIRRAPFWPFTASEASVAQAAPHGFRAVMSSLGPLTHRFKLTLLLACPSPGARSAAQEPAWRLAGRAHDLWQANSYRRGLNGGAGPPGARAGAIPTSRDSICVRGVSAQNTLIRGPAGPR